jgi:hypothetical protein
MDRGRVDQRRGERRIPGNSLLCVESSDQAIKAAVAAAVALILVTAAAISATWSAHARHQDKTYRTEPAFAGRSIEVRAATTSAP